MFVVLLRATISNLFLERPDPSVNATLFDPSPRSFAAEWRRTFDGFCGSLCIAGMSTPPQIFFK